MHDKGKDELLVQLTRIRQICCTPHLLFENYMGESAKKDTCMELIKSSLEGEHRALLFSQYMSMLEILEEELTKLDIGYYKITGATPKGKYSGLVKDYYAGREDVLALLG